ncbi:hypothetical protein QUB63_09325 [Microcoleus sp. ARI1-B5]|uniref:hypothetical protein n=1 Tax=unclassified Microcoleus TaxID=2642155 RepID=UPI002FD525E2
MSIESWSIAYLGYCGQHPRRLLTQKIAGTGDRIYECQKETISRSFNPESLLLSALYVRAPMKASARSSQLVSPPPLCCAPREIQQEGCFRASAERVAGSANNTLPFA